MVATTIHDPQFQQSDVGPIPIGWEAIEIGRLFDIRAGGDLDRSTFSEQSDHEHPYPVYANAHRNNGLYGYSSIFHQRGDSLTVTARGEIGYAVPRYQHFTAIGRLLVLSPKGKTNVRFVSEYINNRLKFAVESTGVPQLTVPQVSKYKLALPSASIEQEAIATVLSHADCFIVGLEAIVAKKGEIRQGVMHELLSGARRLPGYSNNWALRRIGDFTDCVAGGTPATSVSAYWNGDIRWMASGELHQKNVTEVSGRITEAGLAGSAAKMLPENCVLIGLAGQGKTRGTVAINRVPLCTNQSIAAIYPSDAYLPEFLFYNLEWRYDELRELSAGDGGRGGLNLTLIRSIQVQLPNKDEQQAIAGILMQIDQEIDHLRAKLAKARRLKEGMMQELLSGRVRLV